MWVASDNSYSASGSREFSFPFHIEFRTLQDSREETLDHNDMMQQSKQLGV